MMTQPTLDFDAPAIRTNKRDLILAVLSDGRWHSLSEFLRGDHGFTCSSVSQRVGQLIREGHAIERDRRGPDGLGRYRLVG